MQPADGTTSWFLIRRAAVKDGHARAAFVSRYGPLVRAALERRWRGTAWAAEIDDAVQDVFLDCMRNGGALERAEEGRSGGFRGFLFGVTRNVAQRVEQRRVRNRARTPASGFFEGADANEEQVSRAFDRAWARMILAEALAVLDQRAAGNDAALRRVRLLERRFRDGDPVRVVAAESGEDPAHLHRELGQAKVEFLSALRVAWEREVGGGRAAESDLRELLALVS